MVKSRLIRAALLLALPLLSRERTEELPLQERPEREEWERFSERCASQSLNALNSLSDSSPDEESGSDQGHARESNE